VINAARNRAKHLWQSCPKSELKHLRNTQHFTKILGDKDKQREFQLLLKEMENRLKNEEHPKTEGQKTKTNSRFFSCLDSSTTQRRTL
jgi:predicted SprT family Zn-dependent metalloprotease